MSQTEDAAVHNEEVLRRMLRAIALSQGQFSLMLVRCNFKRLRERTLAQLRDRVEGTIQELSLSSSVPSVFATIAEAIGDRPPAALMICGWERIEGLDLLFSVMNNMREEFRQHFHFPIFVWGDETVLRGFLRGAPDFASWATSTHLQLATAEAIAELRAASEEVLRAAIDPHTAQFVTNCEILGCRRAMELEWLKKELDKRGIALDRDLEANLHFVLGRDEYGRDRVAEAIAHYRESLQLWEQYEPPKDAEGSSLWNLEQPPIAADPSAVAWETLNPSPTLVTQAIVHLHLGLCYRRQADLDRPHEREHLQRARQAVEACMELLELARRPDLMAEFIAQEGEILRRLQDWPALARLAKQAIRLDRNWGKAHQLAQDYGFLAEVALQKQKWSDARKYAQKALALLTQTPLSIPQHESLYLLLLAKAEAQLKQIRRAIERLARARRKSDPQYDLHLHLEILQTLRSLHFDRGDYLRAFEIKQEYRAVSAQFGVRAFIGAGRLRLQRHSLNPSVAAARQQEAIAPEIIASGRERDVNSLIDRLGRNDYNLTVIHGDSGVGKSSLVQAGLVPALKQRSIASRDVLPVLVRVYTDWAWSLSKQLRYALGELRLEPQETRLQEIEDDISGDLSAPGNTPCDAAEVGEQLHALRRELQHNGDRNLLTVLIFDQFEEFFFTCDRGERRTLFYEFLRDCLNIGFVKIIVLLREDYIYYLLDWNRRVGGLETVNGDILKKEVRYYLGNFSPEDARRLLNSLNERSSFYLEPDLIDALVADLAEDSGEVRPIELQVVGAQLQTENITTLAKYREVGTKERLVQRFLEEVIRDCGPRNERIARLVLYFLTEENGIRPLKTRAELMADLSPEFLQAEAQNHAVPLDAEVENHPEKLDLVLEIFERAGLIFLLRDFPTNRYQLVHDYLVSFIRQQEEIQENLKSLREKYKKLNTAYEVLAELKRVQGRFNSFLKGALAAAGVGVLVLIGFVGQAQWQRQQGAIAEVEARSSLSKALLLTNNELGALLESLKGAVKLKQTKAPPLTIETESLYRLQQAVYTVTERNRLQGHRGSVVNVAFSPDGDRIATASTDNSVRIWSQTGELLHQLDSHTDWVRAVAWSPDGRLLVSASTDKTLKLWTRDGTLLNTIPGHGETITSLAVAPDGRAIATASLDKTVKLWNLDGQLITMLSGHDKGISSVTFSPDGQTVATASLDSTVKLWTRDGQLRRTIPAHNQSIARVSFSPDGQTIATASTDRTIKLWKIDGTFIKTLIGHTDSVLDVTFSPDGETIASASKDSTVILWRADGTRIRILKGHRQDVWSVAFSPDGQTLASASSDNTVKLWHRYSRALPAFRGHDNEVLIVAFSPNGKVLASASKDRTVRLWTPDAKEFALLQDHQDAVWNLSFSPDGNLFATASEDTTVKIWRRYEPKAIATLKGHQQPVLAVSFDRDGNTIASAGKDGLLKLWTDRGREILSIEAHGQPINSVTFLDKDDKIATASEDGTVKIWNRQGQLLKVLKDHQDTVYSVAYSAKDRLIATASKDNTAKLWNLNGELLQTFEGHSDSVYWVSFNPQKPYLATASEDSTIKLWDFDGKLLATLEGHEQGVLSLSFRPDGKFLASASKDNRVILWNLDLDDLIDRSCHWLGDYLNFNKEFTENTKASNTHLCDE
ncbi:AAA family ATPase [Oxynema sp. CENA135]|uniref:WD40 domain-containing protein n=1 Tax=Oxynema sp. CENA135 TaxID=984206 RepID=UPI00190C991A|nr:AAA family ATPase [Oxynema sp. CENA135]MBK4729687.1 AAA family ATPase [Oxynema sp. CENA135]